MHPPREGPPPLQGPVTTAGWKDRVLASGTEDPATATYWTWSNTFPRLFCILRFRI